MEITACKRLSQLPPYIFVRLAQLKAQAKAAGLDIIDLGQGSPDSASPANAVDAAVASLSRDASTHGYPPAHGTADLRQAVAAWYGRRFGAQLDPEKEVLPLIGSKEGLAHLFMALLDPGQGVLVPSPCYPVHINGVILAGGVPHLMPLSEARGYLPDLDAIPESSARACKLMILNYPNNPTGAVCDRVYLEKALAWCKQRGILLVYDNAYSELGFDGYEAPSILQLPGAKENAIEFHSVSKTYSMAGWRVGFAVGHPGAVGALAKFKGFLDYGVPSFLQRGAAEALNGPQDYVAKMRALYQSRRDIFLAALKAEGWTLPAPKAAMYLWGRLPEGWTDSMAFSERLILEQGVVMAPGVGFGPEGEGYGRLSLIQSEPRLIEAARRIGKVLKAGPKPAAGVGR